jgi:hypothetical protein
VIVLDGAVGAEAIGPDRSVLFVPPRDPLQLPAANRRLATLGIPWRYEPISVTGEARIAVPSADPLLRPLANARIHTHYRLQREGTTGGDSVVLSLADGAPWAVTGARGDGARFVVFGSPLDEEATTVPTSPALVPLLDRAFGTWLARAASAAAARPGEEVALPAPADSVRMPDGMVLPLAQATSFRIGGESGVVVFFANDSVSHAVAVNPPAQESDLTRADRRFVRGALGEAVRFAESPREWQRTIYHARLGSELWRPLLLLVLLLLLAELLVAASGRRRPETERTTER